MKINVAIDGYSGCGKSTIAKQLAQLTGYTYIDSGAMYRAVGLFCHRKGLISENGIDTGHLSKEIKDIRLRFQNGHICLNGEDVEQYIRTLQAGDWASKVSTLDFVRRFLVAEQQAMGKEKGVIMDGRDIGTVVFPDAELKLFLTARPQVRAERRFKELAEKGVKTSIEKVLEELNDRDYRDTHRTESPLRQADDAILVDNSDMTPKQQLEHVLQLFRNTADRY